MKAQSTNKIHSFEKWRIANIDKYKSFVWPQLNYKFSDASVISIVFEQKLDINTKRHPELLNIIKRSNIPYFVINFTDQQSSYYIRPQDLEKKLKLVLKEKNADLSGVTSYWEYRLKTEPQNCLSADIDSLEISNNRKLIAVEAAQLFDTNSKDEAIKHIFRTFKRRKNQVNPKQYLVQRNFSLMVSGEAYILFHQIKPNNLLDDKSPCLLLKNDEFFYEMLCFIKDECKIDGEQKFIYKFKGYLMNNLISQNNIYESYDFIKSL